MNLPQAFLDELRSRISLAQVVGRKVVWDARKSNPGRGDFWAPCPFHQEKTASFHVDDAKGYFYCFGCQAKGDAVDFLRQSENASFMEAVEMLARDAGMALPEHDPEAAKRAAKADGLVEAMEAAVRHYRLQLRSAKAAEARAYLDRRGLAPATLERFEIGFAPEGRTGLLDQLTGKGFALATLVEAGLVGRPRDGGAPYDRFRGRIMFPIRDGRGRAIAFGARAVAPDQQPKYLNSPETPLFHKGRNLYNAGPARAAAHKAGCLVVTEGYMDVIALAEAGIEHAVAPLGTAITEDQLQYLWRLCPEPVVALDGDRAGLNAAHRLIELALPLLASGRALRFALLPAGQDPDDVVRSGGAEAMRGIIADSVPMIDLIWAREIEGQPLDSPERRAALDARLKAKLERISDEGLRGHYQNELRARRAKLFAPARPDRPARGAGPGGMRGRGQPGRWTVPGGAPRPETVASLLARGGAGTLSDTRIRECAILAGLIGHPDLVAEFEDRIERIAFACPDLEKVRTTLLSCIDDALNSPNPSEALAVAIGRRTGRNPMIDLLTPGQVRANRHLSRGADPNQARRAIDEELTRHAAILGRTAETLEAQRAIVGNEGVGSESEGLAWRLTEAATAAFEADRRPLSEQSALSENEELFLSRELEQLIERHRMRQPKNR